ncbi:MAG: glycosyltransferase, partial [Oricola sp.]
MTGRLSASIPFRALDGMARILASRVQSKLSPRAKPCPSRAAQGRPEKVTMLVADDRIDRRVLMQARSLVKAGIRTSVIALPHSGSIDADAAAFPGIEIIRIDPSRPSTRLKGEDQTRLGLLAGLGAAFFLHHHAFLHAALSRPADIVVAHDLPVLGAAAMAADLTGARLFFDAHELYPEQAQLKAWRRHIYRMAERRLLPLADKVTTINPSIARELSQRGAIAEPTVILNVPDMPSEIDVTAKGRRFHIDFDLSDTTRVLLFHGLLSPNRNLAMLVEAMTRIDNDCV